MNGTEQITKEHGRIEKTKAKMIEDTLFLYEKLGVKSFFGMIVRIGVIEKDISRMEKGKESRSRTRHIMITSLEGISIETC